MSYSLAHDNNTLGDRIDDFLSTTFKGHDAVSLLDKLTSVGDPCIFGGMLRDLARAPSESFSSDIDIVVDCDPVALDNLLKDTPSHRNKFGGYRLESENGYFDVWALSNTWAIKEGYVEARSLSDLVATTFFSWDSAVYLYRTHEVIVRSKYYENLASGIVDVNLRDNPSLLGAVARTLRILSDWKSAISPKLADFLFEQLNQHTAADIVSAQRTTIGHISFHHHQLSTLQRELGKRDFFEPFFRYDRAVRTSAF